MDCVTEIVKNVTIEYNKIFEDIITYNAKIYLVGGAIRNIIISLNNTSLDLHDLDFEVYGLTKDSLHSILIKYGSIVNDNFGVMQFKLFDQSNISDWEIPRQDSVGRYPIVKLNPYMSIEDACKRRDLTINSIIFDIKENIIIDVNGGCDDIKHKILRACNTELFVQDPVRFYRVAWFISRLSYQCDVTLNQLCSTMDISLSKYHKSKWLKNIIEARYAHLALQ